MGYLFLIICEFYFENYFISNNSHFQKSYKNSTKNTYSFFTFPQFLLKSVKMFFTFYLTGKETENLPFTDSFPTFPKQSGLDRTRTPSAGSLIGTQVLEHHLLSLIVHTRRKLDWKQIGIVDTWTRHSITRWRHPQHLSPTPTPSFLLFY